MNPHQLDTPNLRTNQYAQHRRSQRILLSVSVLVSGKRANGEAFSEHTAAVVVSAHGALIQLREPVLAGQLLTLQNVKTEEEIGCKVVDVNLAGAGVPKVGVESAEPTPRFWHLSF